MSDNLFLRACRRETVERVPVWFMRQAGRHLPEYRKLREQYGMLELVAQPELAAEVTLQPVQRYGVDAAIVFADILLLLPPLGVDFEFVPGHGPRIARPVRTRADVEQMNGFEVRDELGYVLETLRLVRAELDAQTALIGFAGAPFTVASYMIEGGPSKNFQHTKALMHGEPLLWHALLERVAGLTADYLLAQAEAGAQALQLFDSWVGCLSPADYREFVLPHSRVIFERLEETGVPTIHFGTGTAGFLDLQHRAGGVVQSVDWRVSLADACRAFGDETAVQGNLDPLALLTPGEHLDEAVDAVLAAGSRAAGHIFNLGHGILPATSPETVAGVVERVRQWRPAPVGVGENPS